MMPTPPLGSPGVEPSRGTSSPVPTSTSSAPALAPKRTYRPPHDRMLAGAFDGGGGLPDAAHPPSGIQVSPESLENQTPPFAVAAYARVPSSLTRNSLTRPAMRGLPLAWPCTTVVGPIGTQRSASAPTGRPVSGGRIFSAC